MGGVHSGPKAYTFDPKKDCIGQGGIAVVYKALRKVDSKVFAIKVSKFPLSSGDIEEKLIS